MKTKECKLKNAPDEVKEVRVVGGEVEFFSEHDHRSSERGQSVKCWFYGLCVYIARGLWMALPEHGLFVLYDDLYVMFCHI